MNPESRLNDGLAQLGVPAGKSIAGEFIRYLELLQQWNKAYNLTGITRLEDMVVRHILDSVTARPYLAGEAILDAGTGAGLPGIPLAMLEPSRTFTLLDSVGKKVRFLQQAVAQLRLANVTPVHSRLERWQPAAGFDTVICRAFANLAEFAEVCGRFVAPGGRLLAMKGRNPTAEIAALSGPWQVTGVTRVQVPGLQAERHIVVMERAI